MKKKILFVSNDFNVLDEVETTVKLPAAAKLILKEWGLEGIEGTVYELKTDLSKLDIYFLLEQYGAEYVIEKYAILEW